MQKFMEIGGMFSEIENSFDVLHIYPLARGIRLIMGTHIPSKIMYSPLFECVFSFIFLIKGC